MGHRALALAILTCAAASGGETILEAFDAGVTAWSATLQYGGVANCRATTGPGTGDSQALQVDYVFEGTGTNHHMPKYLHGLTEVGADLSLRRQPLFEPTGELARELGRLAPLLPGLTPASPAPTVAGEARSGCFRDPAGKRVLIVAATRPGHPTTARIAPAAGTWIDALTGDAVTARADILTVELPTGGGRVLVGPAGTP